MRSLRKIVQLQDQFLTRLLIDGRQIRAEACAQSILYRIEFSQVHKFASSGIYILFQDDANFLLIF